MPTTKQLLDNPQKLAEHLLKKMLEAFIGQDKCPFDVLFDTSPDPCELCSKYFLRCDGSDLGECPCDVYTIKTVKQRLTKFIKENLPK